MAAMLRKENIILRLHPLHRILISMILSIITFFLIKSSNLKPEMLLMILWNVFALSYNLLCWMVIFKFTTVQIRHRARKEDGSRFFVFIVILLSSFASMLNVLILIISKDETDLSKAIYFFMAIAGMILSWVMIHTVFSFHYAHLYYYDDADDPDNHAGGLIFPHEKEPDYLDFAYFSFVIGMTFQVSDVEITSRKIRRLVLLHGLLSFAISMFVVALTVNLIAGLKN